VPTLLGQHLEFAATFGTGNFTRGCYLGFGCTPSTATNIAIDGAGNIYVAGTAISDVFPVVNPIALFQDQLVRFQDQICFGIGVCGFAAPFVLKTDPTGLNLIYSTFIGGIRQEGFSLRPVALAVDSRGNAYVASDDPNSFLIKLDPKGNLQFLMQASAHGVPTDVAVDPTGAIFITGLTPDLKDVFLMKLDANGKILSSTDLGPGANPKLALVPPAGVYVAANTTSPNWVTTPEAVQPRCGGSPCANIIVLGFNLFSEALFATYLGGSQTDMLGGIAVDGAGSLYLTGTTSSPDFPVTRGALMTKLLCDATGGCGTKAFVAHLNQAGTALAYSTFLGGTSTDEGHRIAVDGAGNAYVTGLTASTDFPALRAIQPTIVPTFCGSQLVPYSFFQKAGFVSVLGPAGNQLVWSTFLGETSDFAACGLNGPYGIAVDSSQSVYVAGDDLALAGAPVTVHGKSTATAAVAKIGPQGRPLNLTATSLTSAASLAPGVPYSGGLASLFVSGLTGVTGAVAAHDYPLPTQLAGVTVKVGGELAPILAVASLPDGHQQIDFQVPFDQATSSYSPTTVEIDYNGSATFIGALGVAPGIFTLPDGSAAVQHASDFTLVTPAHPVVPGETLVIYATGFGGYSSGQTGEPATGPDQLGSTPQVPIVVSIGNTTCEVLYVGPTPGYVGLYQINCKTSTLLTAGPQKLQAVFQNTFPDLSPLPDSETHSNVVVVPVQ
jgi:uncharacterized protein (TIGR03437 family)